MSRHPPFADRPFVLTGYRPTGHDVRFYVTARQLLTLHNESFDIYSHAFMFIYLAAEACRRREPLVVGILQISYAFVFLASTIAHTFHMIGKSYHEVLFRLDWATIGLSVNVCTASFACAILTSPMEREVLAMVVTCAVFLMHNTRSFSSKPKVTKIIGIAVPSICLWGAYMSRIVAAVATGDEDVVRKLYVAQSVLLMPLFVAAIGLTCFVRKIPERYYPGRFDMFGHSHNIHHIWSSIDAYLLIEGVRRVYNAKTF